MIRTILVLSIILMPLPALAKVSTSGVKSKLVRVMYYVSRRCSGVYAVSGIRRTRIPGGKRSLHATGNALDFHANSYPCAYRALRSYGWKDGMSRDGKRCNHIHISLPGSHRERNGFRHKWC